jgi:hypothetical protein
MSYISPEVADKLCQLTTGLGSSDRELFTNDGVISSMVRRPWIINGINNVCSRGDLAERSIPVELETVSDTRKREKWIAEKYTACRPHIMAILLDAATEAIFNAEAARKFLSKEGLQHRMADALEWITAGEPILGFPAGSFIRRLNELQEDAGAKALEGNVVLKAIESKLNSCGYWKGSMTDILEAMWDEDSAHKRDKHLPQTPVAVGNWITRNIDQLKTSFGITISPLQKSRVGGKQVYVRKFTRTIQPQSDDDTDFD